MVGKVLVDCMQDILGMDRVVGMVSVDLDIDDNTDKAIAAEQDKFVAFVYGLGTR